MRVPQYRCHGRSRCPQRPGLLVSVSALKDMRKSSTTASRPHIFNLSTSIVFLASPGDQQPLSPPQRSLVVGPPVMWEKGRTRKKTVQRYGSETRVHARSQKMVHLSRFQTGVENDPNLCCPSAYLCPRAYLVPVSRSLLNVNLSIGRTHRRCTGETDIQYAGV